MSAFPSDAVPMPPPAANTLMQLQNSNRANLPGSSTGGNYGLNDLNSASSRVNETVNQPTSVINLSNSSDVVIGPMTQYQGAVTIYQYMDATVQRAGNPNRTHLGGIFL